MKEERLRKLAGLNEQFKGQRVLDQVQELLIKSLKLARSDSVLAKSLPDRGLKRMLDNSHSNMLKALSILQDIDKAVEEE